MSTKESYQVFLQSPFWREISTEAKRLSGNKCNRCGLRKLLQAHHRRYPACWFDTTLDDLEVLCRFCHKKHHGLKLSGRERRIKHTLLKRHKPKERSIKNRFRKRERVKMMFQFNKAGNSHWIKFPQLGPVVSTVVP